MRSITMKDITKILAPPLIAFGLCLATSQAAQAQNSTSATQPTATPVAMSPEPRATAATSGATTSTALTLEQVTTTSTVEAITPSDGKGLHFNFRGASLDAILDYLSRAAGFIIVREASVQGKIDVVSHDPLNREEAVALLNTVLNKQGYAAIQNGRTLTIVTRDEARKRDIPVHMGRDPEKVPKSGEMVTQVIPVTHANVAQLIKDIEPLLPTYAVITANESSSAVVLTATQTDVHRFMEIIQSLDSTMSEISTIKVFHLANADATEAAKMVNDLFKAQNTGTSSDTSNSGGRRGGLMMMFGGGNQGNSNRQPISQVTAVADARSNSVIAAAPEEAIPSLQKLLDQIDTSTVEVAEVRVFPLKYADAQTMATIIEDVFNSDQQQSQSTTNSSDQMRQMFVRRFMGGGGQQAQQQTQTPGRKTNEPLVNAVADIRTNAIVVNAAKDMMEQIAQMVEKLDNNPAKDRKVFVYSLRYADPQDTAQLLNSMFGDTTSQNSLNRSNTTTQRTGTNSSNSSSNNRRNSGNGSSFSNINLP